MAEHSHEETLKHVQADLHEWTHWAWLQQEMAEKLKSETQRLQQENENQAIHLGTVGNDLEDSKRKIKAMEIELLSVRKQLVDEKKDKKELKDSFHAHLEQSFEGMEKEMRKKWEDGAVKAYADVQQALAEADSQMAIKQNEADKARAE